MTRVAERLQRFAPLVGIALLALLLRHLNFREAWRSTQALPLSATMLACGAYTLNAIIKALRWHRMLRHQRIGIAARISVAAFMSGVFYGMLTIGRLGELLRAEALIEHGQSKPHAFANALADRILDAAFLLVVAVSCSAIMHPGAMALGMLLALLFAGWSSVAWGRRALRRADMTPDTSDGPVNATKAMLSARVLNAARRFGGSLISILFGRGAAETLLWTATSWGSYFVAIRALASGLGIDAPLLAVVRAIALGTASAALPISFQGLGTREAMLTATLAPYGVSTTQALTLSLLSLMLFYVVLLPLGGIGVVWRQMQRSEHGKQRAAAANLTDGADDCAQSGPNLQQPPLGGVAEYSGPDEDL